LKRLSEGNARRTLGLELVGVRVTEDSKNIDFVCIQAVVEEFGLVRENFATL
jgi:hypothetical protein